MATDLTLSDRALISYLSGQDNPYLEPSFRHLYELLPKWRIVSSAIFEFLSTQLEEEICFNCDYIDCVYDIFRRRLLEILPKLSKVYSANQYQSMLTIWLQHQFRYSTRKCSDCYLDTL